MYAVVKAGISAVPIVGGAAAELLGLALAPPLEKRRAEWFESVAERLKKVEVKFETLGDDPAFVTTVLQATQIATRTHQQEKLRALQNAVVNTALHKLADDNLRSLFLAFVDEFTPAHVRMLAFFKNPTSARQFTGNRQIDDQIVNALVQRGLIEDTRPFAARGRPTDDPLTNYQWNVTWLGDQFLRFISV